MDKVLRVGVVGCGQIAQIAHLPFLNELPGFEVSVICDISPRVLEMVGKRFGIEKRLLDYRELVALPELDAVLICNVDHYEVAVAAMSAGKHVMCEKPMAFNLEQCDAMIDASKSNNVKLMIAYMKRYDPGYEWALPLFNSIENLRLIRVHDLAGDYHINNEIYDLIEPSDLPDHVIKEATEKEHYAKVRAIGHEREFLVGAYGLLLSLCSHDAIILHEAFGAPRRILFADIYANNHTVAVFEYGHDIRCVWESGFLIDRTDWDEHLFAYGTNLSVQVKFPFPYLKNAATLVSVNQMEGKANVQKEVIVSYDEAFKREWRHFYECVNEDKEPITNGEKGRRDIAFLIDIVKAAYP